MPFLYDNLIATVISMTVVLVLSSIQMEANRINTARTSRNIVNTQAQQLATWLEEDLSRMGQNMSGQNLEVKVLGTGGTCPKSANICVVNEGPWQTSTVEFDYKKPGGTTVTVVYEVSKMGEKETIQGNEIPLRRLQRQPNGGSASRLGFFKVKLLDENANPTSNPDEIEFIQAKFSIIAPFQSEATFPRRVRRSVSVPYQPN